MYVLIPKYYFLSYSDTSTFFSNRFSNWDLGLQMWKGFLQDSSGFETDPMGLCGKSAVSQVPGPPGDHVP